METLTVPWIFKTYTVFFVDAETLKLWTGEPVKALIVPTR